MSIRGFTGPADRSPGTENIGEPGGRFMVAVTPEPGMTALVRRAWRIAAGIGADLYVVHISNGDATPGVDFELAALRDLAVDLGATWYNELDYDIPGTLIRLAVQRRITHIVLGPGRRGRWHGIGSPVVRRILREAAPAGIDVHVMAMAAGSWGYQAAEE
jgi:K+-sensing histidine kinase KdpD